MAARLTQAPLPAGAAEVAPGAGLAECPDGGGVVWVHGMATFCWEAGDEAGRRLAAAQLAELKAATQQQVAAAFGIGVVTMWRWLEAYRRDGLAGLLPARRGPKGPGKLTPELTGKIRELDAAGKSQAAIAAGCGVSAFAVRTALGRVPARPAAAARAGDDAAGPGGRRRGGGPGAGCAAGAWVSPRTVETSPMKVSGDGRDAEEVRSGLQGGRGAAGPGDREADRAGGPGAGCQRGHAGELGRYGPAAAGGWRR